MITKMYVTSYALDEQGIVLLEGEIDSSNPSRKYFIVNKNDLGERHYQISKTAFYTFHDAVLQADKQRATHIVLLTDQIIECEKEIERLKNLKFLR